MESKERLRSILEDRSRHLSPELRRRIFSSSEIVIFGSFAANLEDASSDIDVFCIGETRTHYKTKSVEVLILPEYEVFSDLWLGSEIAHHISTYGVPLGDAPEWFRNSYISASAIEKKIKRISAYLRALNRSWISLSSSARQRYEVKLCRELQRLDFLEHGKAVPPTKVLDTCLDQKWINRREPLDANRMVSDPLLKKLFPALLAAK